MRGALLSVTLFLFASALSCLAQDASSGAIRGTVFDPSGSRITGASIALVNDATGLRYDQTSDAQGRFAFGLLPAGEYSARVTAEKMSPQLSQGVRVDIGSAIEITFRLAIAGTAESVTVSAEPRSVETQPWSLGHR